MSEHDKMEDLSLLNVWMVGALDELRRAGLICWHLKQTPRGIALWDQVDAAYRPTTREIRAWMLRHYKLGKHDPVVQKVVLYRHFRDAVLTQAGVYADEE